ncbi:MAG: CBS domain-containing protein [Bacilli bacterium]|nr:CBS domain-containing protein [Bacilli bacterium]
MKIKNIMTKKIISCKSYASIYEISKKMKQYNIGFMPIIDNTIKGVITDRDIVTKCLYNHDSEVKSYINNPIICVDADDELDKALDLMKENKIKRLIVTKEKEIVGILSLSDILNHYDNNKLIDTIKTIYELKDNLLNNTPKVDDYYL